jgi:hypothetical protein
MLDSLPNFKGAQVTLHYLSFFLITLHAKSRKADRAGNTGCNIQIQKIKVKVRAKQKAGFSRSYAHTDPHKLGMKKAVKSRSQRNPKEKEAPSNYLALAKQAHSHSYSLQG